MDLRATRSITGRGGPGRRNGEESGGYGSLRHDELKKLNEISPRSSAKRKSRHRRERERKVSFLPFSSSPRDTKRPRDRFLEEEEEEASSERKTRKT